MPLEVRLTTEAEADVVDILRESARLFGDPAQRRYDRLFRMALRDLAADARRPGVQVRVDLGTGLYSYHLVYSREQARRVGALVRRPRHVVIFRLLEPEILEVVRVLHDRMDLVQHLAGQPKA